MSDNARTSNKDSGRRRFIQTLFSGAVIGVAAQAGIESATPYLYSQTSLSPDAVLQALLAGNQRFAANRLISIEHDLSVLRERTINKQEPFALSREWLAIS